MIAHLVSTGLGPIYDGILHLLSTPEDLVPVVALALFAGLRGASSGRNALFLLPGAWLAGGLAGLQSRASVAFPVPAISFLALGAFVASDLRLSARAVAILSSVLGLLHGFLNGIALRATPSGALCVAGAAAVVFAIVALVSAAAVSVERPWARVAVRVAGSWIAAAGLLLLGWGLRAPR